MNCSETTNQKTLHQGELRADSIGYMPGLDGLRALAVFAVILYHLDLSWAPGGLLGVSLFFVLSGYLITNILLNQWERTGSIDLRDFWLRRARRLLPALFATLAGTMAWVAIFAPERLAALKQEVLAAVFYVSNWYLIFHDVSYFESFGPPSPLGHLWSLAVEEQFYLFWPLLLGLGLRFLPQRKWVIRGTVAVALISVAAMAMIYIPGHDPSRVYYGTDTRAFSLLVGALLAMIWPSRKLSPELSGKKKLALDVTGSMGLLIVLLMIGKTNQYQTFLYPVGLLLFSVAAACAVASLAHPAGSLGRIFGWRPLRWLGECSYGIYLWHYPVIALTSPAVNTGSPDLFLSLWQIAASIVLAVLSRYLIEEPIRYGRWKPTALSFKLSVNLLLIFLILFVAAREGTQISAKDLEGQASEPQVQISEPQAIEVQAQGGEDQSQEVEGQMQADKGQVQEAGEQAQLPDTEGTAAGQQPSAPGDETGGTVPEETADGQEDAAEQGSDIKGNEITAIGDSLMIDVTPVLQERLPGLVVDAKIGRQMHQATDVISKLQKAGKLRKTVIIGLGTNGSFTEKQLAKTLDALEGVERIVLVNTRVPKPWESVVNETLAKVVSSYPNVRLIDWYSASGGHDDYFYPDGVHLKRNGAEAYCEVLLEALNEL